MIDLTDPESITTFLHPFEVPALPQSPQSNASVSLSTSPNFISRFAAAFEIFVRGLASHDVTYEALIENFKTSPSFPPETLDKVIGLIDEMKQAELTTVFSSITAKDLFDYVYVEMDNKFPQLASSATNSVPFKSVVNGIDPVVLAYHSLIVCDTIIPLGSPPAAFALPSIKLGAQKTISLGAIFAAAKEKSSPIPTLFFRALLDEINSLASDAMATVSLREELSKSQETISELQGEIHALGIKLVSSGSITWEV